MSLSPGRGRRWRIVEFEPRPLDQIAADRDGRLLVLRRELHRPHRRLQFIEGSLGFPFGVQQISDLTTDAASGAQANNRLLLRDRREVQMPPAVLLQQMTDQIVWMQALHDDDNRTFRLVIEPRQQRVGVPLFERVPGTL